MATYGEMFDEMLDEVYPEVRIGGATLYPSRMLKEGDPIAYREYFNNYSDAKGWGDVDTDDEPSDADEGEE